MEYWISIISAFIAITSAVIAYRSLSETRRITSYANNFSGLFNAESKLHDHPELLELHGVTQELLKKNKVTSKEVVYLLHSIRAGQEFSRIKNPKKYQLSKYRKHLFSHTKSQVIWNNILKERFIFGTSFARAVDDFLVSEECKTLTKA